MGEIIPSGSKRKNTIIKTSNITEIIARADKRRTIVKRWVLFLFIGFFLFLGLFFITAPSFFNFKGNIWDTIFVNIGVGLIATCMISFFLELTWSKYRSSAEKIELDKIIGDWKAFTQKLTDLQNRLTMFEQLGLNQCFSDREEALKAFLPYAKEALSRSRNEIECVDHVGCVNIVSSSARGLLGYLDREPSKVQEEWCNLVVGKSKHFRFLLTHPAYAHLRQPAEERESGDIEVEILKTAVFLYCVCQMDSNSLRLYRGSPTLFQIQIGSHILLNPYPYGKMAMDTLSLEFEVDRNREGKEYFVEEFASKHFNHTWAFFQQPSKRVDGKPLVVGIDTFEDILSAFGECTYIDPLKFRLNEAQIKELDFFTVIVLKSKFPNIPESRLPKGNTPFMDYLTNNKSDIKYDI